MLSRRNIRIKVMQVLYSKRVDHKSNKAEIVKQFDAGVRQFFEAYLYNLYLIERIAKFAVDDLKIRKAKHLPAYYDRIFTSKLYDNELIQSLVQNTQLQKQYEALKFDKMSDEDLIKKLYNYFAETTEYQNYITQSIDDNISDDNDDEGGPLTHLDALLAFYRFIRKHELFVEMVDNNYRVWSDDSSLVIGAVKKSLKRLPTEGAFFNDYQPDNETINDFGYPLLHYILDQDETLTKIIRPRIENWDISRIALLDLIFIKMAIAEFLIFENIPTKVSINEYVELSKRYSTDKSKEFVNGVLDKVLENLKRENRIKKIERS